MREGIKKYGAFIIWTLVMVIPIIIFASKSVPAADDFSNAVRLLEQQDEYSNRFSLAFARSIDLYKNTSGYFFAAFLNYLFTPYLRWGLNGLRIFNILANAVFFLSLFFLVQVFTRKALKMDQLFMWAFFCILLTELINGYSNSEIYTWYCVLVAYILPVSLMFISLALCIESNTDNRFLIIPAAVLGFLVSGSSLNLAALNCGLVFLASAYMAVFLKRTTAGAFYFLLSLVGAIINVLSPGNYIRHDSVNPNYNILWSVRDAVECTVRMVKGRILGFPLIALCLIVLVICLGYVDYSRIELSFRFPICAAFVVFIGVVIVTFPVCFGYSKSYLPDRAYFISDIALYLLAFMWCIYFAGFIKRIIWTKPLPSNFAAYSSVFLIAAIMFHVGFCGGPNAYTTGGMITLISNGSLGNFAEHEESILSEIEGSLDDHVVLERPYELQMPYMKSIGISEDSSYWINIRLAQYYNKETVVIVYSGKQ